MNCPCRPCKFRSHVPVPPIRGEIQERIGSIRRPHNPARCELLREDGGRLSDRSEESHTPSQTEVVQNNTSNAESSDVDDYETMEKIAGNNQQQNTTDVRADAPLLQRPKPLRIERRVIV